MASLVLSGAIAWAQLSTAQLSGRVADESGAVLPGVSVTATQTDTGLVRTVTTDENGTYVLPNLPTGPYRLEAMLQGFRTFSQTGIVLQVAATPAINVVIGIGSLEETVSVEAAAPLVDVQSAGIGDVIDNERILELPLQGRQVTDLIVLAGAAVQTGVVGTRNFPGGVTISVAGGSPIGVGYLLDGAVHNSPQSNVNLPMPFPDALQEFRVQTSGLSAQNGMHAAASVNAVTKSGTNAFHGSGFEFLRHRALNATAPLASIGPDGKRSDDGLLRNQFGGTLGGPIARDKLFFFGAYQGTMLRYRPADLIAFVPTAQMLAGDFTAITAPSCTGGRQINLGGGFVENRINPALFSPAAMNLARRLPATTDPCGQVTFQTTDDSNEGQGVGRIDYQLTPDHSVFGRYMATFIRKQPAYQGGSDNVLKAGMTPPGSAPGGLDNLAHALAIGDTWVLGPTMVNSVRVAYNRTTVNRFNAPYFDPADLGIKLHPYVKGQMAIQVLPSFEIPAGATKALFRNNFYQVGDDVTLIRGRHQFGFGGNVSYFDGFYQSSSRAAGIWIFDGSATGHGLADLLLGRVTSVEHGAQQSLPVHGWYLGFYGQDTWRAAERVTFNLGLRWEPYLGTSVDSGAVYNFNHDNFLRGVKSNVFVNAPAGMLYPGDAGFPSGMTGLNKQWTNFSPRIGVAWDVTGNGRMALRASYALAYDFMAGDYHNINSSAPPFGNRSLITDPPGRMDDPYGARGRRSAPDRDRPQRGVPRVRLLRHHGSRHQLPARAELERHVGAAVRHQLGRLGQLSRQLFGSGVGADGHQPGRLHGSQLDQRQPEPAPRALPGEPCGRAIDRDDGSERRHRLAGVPRPEAVGAAPVGRRSQSERATTPGRAAWARKRRTRSPRSHPGIRTPTTRSSTRATAITIARTWGASHSGRNRRTSAAEPSVCWPPTGAPRAS